MGIQAKAEVKFALIEAALLNPNNLLSVTELCKIACVSRSGFYRWQESKPTREEREKQGEDGSQQEVCTYASMQEGETYDEIDNLNDN